MKIKAPVNLGILASGRGSNMQAILDACRDNKLLAKPVVIISNNRDSGALKIARKEKIPAYHLSKNTTEVHTELDRLINHTLCNYHVDLVILAGYMKKLGKPIIDSFRNRIINIHPSLLPSYGGRGMYGLKVHQAVIDAGEKVSGVTVHLVDNEYDRGKILAQSSLSVNPDDNAESLAKRLLKVEHAFYPDILQRIITGDIKLPGVNFYQ